MGQLDIYFGSSITHQVSVEERKLIYRILERNPKIREILPGHINKDDVREWGIRKIAEGTNFYDHGLWDVASTDGMVANLNDISTGVGYEMAAQVLHFGRPVLALVKEGVKVTVIAYQNTEPRFTFKTYTNEEQLPGIIDQWLVEVETAKAKRGKFIVLEGADYCGKDTQLGMLAGYLFSKDDRTFPSLTREPFGVLRPKIREILKSSRDINQTSSELADLFIADRRDHLFHAILPDIGKGRIVLCSRYKLSTCGYQPAQLYFAILKDTGNEQLAEEKETIFLEELLKRQEIFPNPDLTIVLDIPPKERRKRALEKQKSNMPDKFEADLVLQERVNNNYLRLVGRLNSKNTVKVCGVGPKESVFERIKDLVDIVVN